MGRSARVVDDLRRAIRYGASCDVAVDAIGDDIYPSVLMDISSTGFRAMVDGLIAPSALVRLRIGVYPELTAVVVWQKGSVIGCEFLNPLTRTILLTILRTHSPPSWSDPAVYLGDASLGF